ncbi:MAG: hypothetical protein EYC68_21565 [Chloroflexota bacterium]|nr:MAG: hypothetical protein EYC68_21565 [Chloroflexota bacterium]
MLEAVVKTEFGEVHISYNNTEELKTALQEIVEQAKVIAQETQGLIPVPPRPPRQPKPGYEAAYQFSPSGKAELLIFPQVLVQVAVLALFAYHPDPVSASELEHVTGIADIVGKVLGQTANKKYFRKTDNGYGLSTDGLALFMEKVKPLVDEAAQGNQEAKGEQK